MIQLLRNRLFGLADALSRRHKTLVFLIVDVFLAPLMFYVSAALAYNTLFPFGGQPGSWVYYASLPVMAATLSNVLGIPKIKLKAYEAHAVLRTAVLASLLCIGLVSIRYLTDLHYNKAGIVLFGLLFFFASVGLRVAMLRTLIWVHRLGQPRCRVLIYGAGATGMQLVAALRNHNSIIPVAFLDDNIVLQSLSVSGLKVLSPNQIALHVRNLDIDRVLLAMPSVSAPKQAQIARRLQALHLEVFAVPSFAQLVGTEALVDNLAPVSPGQFLGRKPIETMLPEGASAYEGRSILVSGAGGSIGSELCRQLVAHHPRRIVLFEVSEVALYNIDRELRDIAEGRSIEIVPVLGSVADSRTARLAMTSNSVDVVLHAAAYKHVPLVEANPIAGLSNNVLGTRTLADAADEAGVERFILISTDKAVRPTNIMGASKRLAEMVIQDLAKRSAKTTFSMVRFGNVLGSSGSVVPLFTEQIARGGPLTLTHEDVTRFFMTISEAVRLVLLAGSFSQPGKPKGGDVFVLDMGEPMRIRDLARKMIEAAGYTVRDAGNPDGDIEIEVIGLRPGEKLHEELLIGEGLLTTPHSKILRAREISLSELDMAKALQNLRNAVARGDADAARAVAVAHVEGYTVAGSEPRPSAASVAGIGVGSAPFVS